MIAGEQAMGLWIDIPAELEPALREAWGDDLSRAALEALVIEGYRGGKFSAFQVGQILGLGDRWAVNQWLADRHVPMNYTIEDLEADRRTLDRLLGKSG